MTFTTFASGFTKSAFTAGRARYVASRLYSAGAFRNTMTMEAKPGQAEVVLVGCGAPNRGMGWYHAIQMLEGR